MPKPSLCGSPMNLKTQGTNTLWLCVNDAAVNDNVLIKRKDNGPGYWSGTIRGFHPRNRKGAMVQVTYYAGTPPHVTTRKKKVYGPGDIIDVDITVTSSGGTSDPLGGQVIID